MSDSVTKYYEMMKDGDPTVRKVVDLFQERSQKGIAKYGTTLSGNPLSLIEWLEHAKEEAMDQVLYLQRAIDELRNRPNSI
jgi:hypothetical protein